MEISSYDQMVNKNLDDLAVIYREVTGNEPDTDLIKNRILYDAFWFLWRELSFISDLRAMIREHPEYFDKIGQHAKEHDIFRYQAIFIIYYWANFAPIMTRNNSPLTPEDLRIIFEDSGFESEYFDWAKGNYSFYPNF